MPEPAFLRGFFFKVCLFGCAGPLLSVFSSSRGTRASLVAELGLQACELLVSQALEEHRLSSCDARASLLHSTWDLPGSEKEPTSSVLAGGFFTTEPQGKPIKEGFRKEGG